MGWSRPNEESRADHYRDERKHDFDPLPPRAQKTVDSPRLSDPVPARLDRPITTAEDIAAQVKRLDILAGAALIEQYARTFNAGART